MFWYAAVTSSQVFTFDVLLFTSAVVSMKTYASGAV